jgi:hypothetical protein
MQSSQSINPIQGSKDPIQCRFRRPIDWIYSIYSNRLVVLPNMALRRHYSLRKETEDLRRPISSVSHAAPRGRNRRILVIRLQLNQTIQIYILTEPVWPHFCQSEQICWLDWIGWWQLGLVLARNCNQSFNFANCPWIILGEIQAMALHVYEPTKLWIDIWIDERQV